MAKFLYRFCTAGEIPLLATSPFAVLATHRFRHTFAVELLLAGVRIDQVSKLLGHKTVRTTERYYSAWVKERQRKLEEEVKQAWRKMELPTVPGSKIDAASANSNFAEIEIDGMIQ